jgi:MFS family permease
MPHAALAPRSVRLLLGLIALAVFTETMMYDMVVPFLPSHVREWGVDEVGVGLLFAVYAVPLILTTIFLGRFADRMGRRGPLLTGAFGLALAALFFCLADCFVEALLARLLQGAASAALGIGGLALLADLCPNDRRGRTMGVFMTAMSLGTMLGPPLGGVLYDWSGYLLPFLFSGGLALSVGILLTILMPRRPARREGVPPTPGLWREPRILRAALVVLAGSTVLSLLEPTLPVFLEQRLHAGPRTIGFSFILATLAYGCCAPLGGMLSDRIGRMRTSRGGLIVTGLALPLIALPGNWPAEVATLVLLGVGCAFLLTPTLPELADAADQHGGVYGQAYAIFNLAYAGGMLIGPLAGTLVKWIGFLPTLVVVGLVLLALVPFLSGEKQTAGLEVPLSPPAQAA